MNKLKATIVTICIAAIGITSIIVYPAFRALSNGYEYMIKDVDQRTNYKLQKDVEDTCRSMVASYESDKLMYEQYKNSTNKEKIMWADSAKIRANSTANRYNEYIRKNRYVWDGNIPKDIDNDLPIIE